MFGIGYIDLVFVYAPVRLHILHLYKLLLLLRTWRYQLLIHKTVLFAIFIIAILQFLVVVVFFILKLLLLLGILLARLLLDDIITILLLL